MPSAAYANHVANKPGAVQAVNLRSSSLLQAERIRRWLMCWPAGWLSQGRHQVVGRAAVSFSAARISAKGRETRRISRRGQRTLVMYRKPLVTNRPVSISTGVLVLS